MRSTNLAENSVELLTRRRAASSCNASQLPLVISGEQNLKIEATTLLMTSLAEKVIYGVFAIKFNRIFFF